MAEKKYKQVTRKDVAEEAGVSVTIVSYVINNNRYVDKEKRIKVEEAIKKLHYKPNSIARALKGKKLNHIVFIADQIVTEHFSLLVSELDKHAYDLGYMISLCSNRNTQQFIDSIISRQYDGVIISSISFDKEYIKQLIAADIPVVLLVNRDYDDIEGAAKIENGLYECAISATAVRKKETRMCFCRTIFQRLSNPPCSAFPNSTFMPCNLAIRWTIDSPSPLPVAVCPGGR